MIGSGRFTWDVASTADGAKVQQYTDNGTGAQRFSITAGSDTTTFVLTNQTSGKCLDVAAAGTANGTKVQLYDCNGTGAQQWTQGANGSLVNTGSGKCLDDTDWSTTDGTQLQIWTCTGTANQSWTLG